MSWGLYSSYQYFAYSSAVFSKSSLLTIESVRSFPLAILWWFAVKEQIDTKVRIHFQKCFSKFFFSGPTARHRLGSPAQGPISDLNFGGKMPKARFWHRGAGRFFRPATDVYIFSRLELLKMIWILPHCERFCWWVFSIFLPFAFWKSPV